MHYACLKHCLHGCIPLFPLLVATSLPLVDDTVGLSTALPKVAFKF